MASAIANLQRTQITVKCFQCSTESIKTAAEFISESTVVGDCGHVIDAKDYRPLIAGLLKKAKKVKLPKSR